MSLFMTPVWAARRFIVWAIVMLIIGIAAGPASADRHHRHWRHHRGRRHYIRERYYGPQVYYGPEVYVPPPVVYPPPPPPGINLIFPLRFH